MINEQSIAVASAGLIGAILWSVLRTRRADSVSSAHRKFLIWARTFFGAVVCGICSVTLFPILLHIGDEPIFSTNLTPFGTISAIAASQDGTSIFWNLIGNAFLFLPLGFLGPSAHPIFRNFWWMLVASCVFSITIEFLQYLEVITKLASNRAIDVDDIILNVAGAMLGWWLNSIVCKFAAKCATHSAKRSNHGPS